MILLDAYVGFHRPRLRDEEGRLAPRAWFGHVEMWGHTRDGTWLFLDPQASGLHILVAHRHDEVRDLLALKFSQCSLVLREAPDEDGFRFPVHWQMTCASVVGSAFGIRAWSPAGLRRKLLAKGAEVIHGGLGLQGKRGGQGDAAA